MSDLNELTEVYETSSSESAVSAAEPAAQEATGDAAETKGAERGKVDNNAETTAAEAGGTAKPDPEEGAWTKQAYLDEKRKRQELQKELEDLKKPAPKQQEDDPDLFADPDGFKQSIQQSIKNESLKTRVDISRDLLMDAKPDYVEKEAKFMEMAKADPSLVSKLYASPNPAKFAYQTAEKQLALDAIGDPVSYREKLKAELLKELKAELPAKPAKQDDDDDTPNLATVSGANKAEETTLSGLAEVFDD